MGFNIIDGNGFVYTFILDLGTCGFLKPAVPVRFESFCHIKTH